jgi:ABC-type sugar transport system substrate-binding protein
MKTMKLAKLFLPAIAIMAIALGNTPALSAQKIKIGVAMALFDDVWLTNVRDAMTKWASTHPDVRPMTPPSRLARWKTSWLREWMR